MIIQTPDLSIPTQLTIALVPDLGAALEYGVETTPAGGELVVLPTYTAMLALRHIASEQGLVRPYWEEAVG